MESIIQTFRQALVLSEKNQTQLAGQHLAFETIIAIGACKEKAAPLTSLILPWLHSNDPSIIHYAICTLGEITVGPHDALAWHITPFLTHEYAMITIAAQEVLDKLTGPK